MVAPGMWGMLGWMWVGEGAAANDARVARQSGRGAQNLPEQSLVITPLEWVSSALRGWDRAGFAVGADVQGRSGPFRTWVSFCPPSYIQFNACFALDASQICTSDGVWNRAELER